MTATLDNLYDAWERVRTGGDGPGCDQITLRDFEGDLSGNLSALADDIDASRYQPQPYRAVDIPKNAGGHRRIVIPTVRDRVAMTAALLWLYPQIEPLLHPCSFAYRRGHGVQDALALTATYRDRGFLFVLRTDIARFFDSVNHSRLFEQLAGAGMGQDEIAVLYQWLNTSVLSPEGLVRPLQGLPQGLPISPLLANLYLTPFDRLMVEAGWKLVRYADDLCICCAQESEIVLARKECERALAMLDLQCAEEKTGETSFSSGFSFLGVRFVGNDIIPETPHPYERAFQPPPKPKRLPPQPLPKKMLRTLYVQQQGSTLGCHGGRLVIRRDGTALLDLPAHHIDQVFTFGRVHISSAAMAFCLRQEIPIHLFSGRGRYYGVLHTAGSENLNLRRAQYALLDDPGRRLVFARTIVAARLRGARHLIQRHARNHPGQNMSATVNALAQAAGRAQEAAEPSQLRGIEGAATAQYYQALATCLPESFAFTQRVRRPPTDPVNSLLSFAATLVFHNLHAYLLARGLDPAAGLYHEPRAGHMALVSDLMEEFRAPLVEALVLSVCNRHEFSPADFYRAPGTPQPCLLTDEARPRFLNAFETALARTLHHPDAEAPVDWRRLLDLQVSRFRRYVQGAVVAYAPFEQE